jgi:hypothetical protein
MQTRNNLARLGGLVAFLSLLFLPLASCGDAQFTGTELLFSVEEHFIHRGILLIALVAAGFAVVVAKARTQLFAGIVGILAIGLEWFSAAQDDAGTIQLLYGSFLALAGFVLVFAAGLMGRKEKT